MRKILQDEAREIREREERARSVVIRGLGSDPKIFNSKFKDVAKSILGQDISPDLVKIVPIKPNLIRGKIADDGLRSDILQATRLLKTHTTLSEVYIKKYLTYKQRQALIERANARSQNIRPDPPATSSVQPLSVSGNPLSGKS
ncbi:hypothetical protein Pcinc_028675 [Petrolisthes cinctipes]|uniref:Uncharacterized protein n=1 Tax=Petrolisthes cinctipes TaxID=88211 RepID=A0AAE1F1J4_PETCI|nr:hypothetical protein Pcinc_028675 [Petrolisthes cinctipes]